MATPYELISLDTVGSTQDEARKRFVASPVVVVSAEQIRGRGRTGRAWWQAPRAVYASLAFRPGWPSPALPLLSLVAGLAAREVLHPTPGLKWPNDLVEAGDGLPGSGRKIGGLLAENSAGPGPVVVGLGVNLWWPQPPVDVAGLLAADPGPEEAAVVAANWATALLRLADAGPDAWGRDRYERACVTIGHEVTWHPGGSGKAVGIAEDGALEVETNEGVIRLTSGEVRRVRPATLGDRSGGSGEVGL